MGADCCGGPIPTCIKMSLALITQSVAAKSANCGKGISLCLPSMTLSPNPMVTRKVTNDDKEIFSRLETQNIGCSPVSRLETENIGCSPVLGGSQTYKFLFGNRIENST